MTRNRSQRVPSGAKKARKSAALIIAEKDISEIKADIATIYSLLKWIAGGVGTACLTIAAYTFNYLLGKL